MPEAKEGAEMPVSSKPDRRAEKRMRQFVADLGSEQNDISQKAETNLIRYYGARPVSLLIDACDSENETVRFRAAWILGKAGDSRAFDALLRLTADPLPSVRYDATLALSHLGDLRAIDPLIRLMCAANEDDGVSSVARNALAMLGEPAISPLLALGALSSPHTLIGVASVFFMMKSETTRPFLIKLAANDDPNVRVAADEALDAINEAFPEALSPGSPAPSA